MALDDGRLDVENKFLENKSGRTFTFDKFTLENLANKSGCVQINLLFFLYITSEVKEQRAKKVMSDSPGLVDFAIGLVNSVPNLRASEDFSEN